MTVLKMVAGSLFVASCFVRPHSPKIKKEALKRQWHMGQQTMRLNVYTSENGNNLINVVRHTLK